MVAMTATVLIPSFVPRIVTHFGRLLESLTAELDAMRGFMGIGILLMSASASASIGVLEGVELQPEGHEKSCIFAFPEDNSLAAVVIPAVDDCPQEIVLHGEPSDSPDSSASLALSSESDSAISEEVDSLLGDCVRGHAEILIRRGPDGLVTEKQILTIVPSQYNQLAKHLVAETPFPAGSPNSEEVATMQIENPACH